MAANPLSLAPLALNDADLESVARVAERLLAGRPLRRAGGLVHRRRIGTGLEFHDYRDYVPGDEPRHIDWRASARGRELKLRRFNAEGAAEWMIALDRSASMGTNGAEKWRLAAEIAAGFAYVLLALSCRVGAIGFSGGVDALCPLGRGPRHYARVLETIAVHPPVPRGGDSDLAACVPAIKKDTGVIVISDFLRRDAMRPALAILAPLSGGLHAIRITSDADVAGPADGALSLRDAETGAEREVMLDAALRASVRRAVAAQSAAWQDGCRSLAIPSSTASPDLGWKKALLAHLSTMGPRRA